MTRLLVLLGDPVEHSLSPQFQNAALEAQGLDARYVALRADAADLPGLLRGIARGGGAGNVTLPHKELAARTVEAPTEVVRQTGACNTFWLEDGVIHGDNTDVEGLRGALEALHGGPLDESDGLVLGAGGAARGAIVALARAGVRRIWIRNRTRERADDLVRALADRVRGARLALWEEAELPGILVNATSLGLGDSDPSPLDPTRVPLDATVMDLVYRPGGETRWVRELRERGVRVADGREMLLRQGALSFERWWGRPAPLDVMRGGLESASMVSEEAP